MPIKPMLAPLAIFILITSFPSHSQVQADNPLRKVYSRDAYLSDLDELVHRLTSLHPQPFEFISETAFNQLVDETRRTVSDRTTIGEYIWMYSKIVASIGCGHTSLSYFNQEDQLLPVSLRFPIEARFIGDKLYVTDPLINTGRLSVGDEITEINGQRVSDIQRAIYQHIPTDGHIRGYKQALANAYFTAYVAYHFQFPDSYVISVNDDTNLIELNPLNEYQYKPIISPEDECQQKLCLKILADEQVAVMTIRSSAYYDNLDVFKKYVDRSFSMIKASGLNNLILDFRGNHGGSSQANAYLLRQFAKQPFSYYSEETAFIHPNMKHQLIPAKERFTGNVFVLMDGDTLSATGHFLSLVKAHQFATLIGEEAGSTYSCNDKSEHFEASHTGITYRVATNTFSTPVKGMAKNQGVLPDHEVIPDIADFLHKRDPVMAYALKLIAQNKGG